MNRNPITDRLIGERSGPSPAMIAAVAGGVGGLALALPLAMRIMRAWWQMWRVQQVAAAALWLFMASVPVVSALITGAIMARAGESGALDMLRVTPLPARKVVEGHALAALYRLRLLIAIQVALLPGLILSMRNLAVVSLTRSSLPPLTMLIAQVFPGTRYLPLWGLTGLGIRVEFWAWQVGLVGITLLAVVLTARLCLAGWSPQRAAAGALGAGLGLAQLTLLPVSFVPSMIVYVGNSVDPWNALYYPLCIAVGSVAAGLPYAVAWRMVRAIK